VTSDDGNVMLDWVKCAFDMSGDVIVRVYEAYGSPTNVMILFNFDIKGAMICNLLEENLEHVKCSSTGSSNTVQRYINAHEVRSTRKITRVYDIDSYNQGCNIPITISVIRIYPTSQTMSEATIQMPRLAQVLSSDINISGMKSS